MFLHGSGAEHGGAVIDPFAGQKQLFSNIEINVYIPVEPRILTGNFQMQDLLEDEPDLFQRMTFHVSNNRRPFLIYSYSLPKASPLFKIYEEGEIFSGYLHIDSNYYPSIFANHR